MSYEIVKSVKISDDGTVTIKSASNNVWPRTPSNWPMPYRNEHNPFTGKLAAEVEVFAGYEQGTFQGGSNKFTRQLSVLRAMPEYAAFDWRSSLDNDREDKKAYYELLAKALQMPVPKERYIISKHAYGSNQTVFGRYRKGGRAIYWTLDKTKATKYPYPREAEAVKSYFNGSEAWEVVAV